MSAARLDALEREIAVLRGRIDALERERRAPAERAPLRNPPAPVVEQVRVSAVDIEELLGGRLLALAGAIAFLLGIAFFVALAIDRGWIGVTARVVLAALASTALFAGGA